MKNMENPKKTVWKILKCIAPAKSGNNQYIGDPTGIANAFNKHFININIQHSDAVVAYANTNEQDKRLSDYIETHISDTTKFCIPVNINTQQVIKDLKNIPNKVTGLDRIGVKPLKVVLNVIAPSLTHIYNASISSGTFPTNFKRAKLTLVHKKDSLYGRNNYHPISVLPIISKSLERYVSQPYLGYLTSNNLLHSKQSAYHPYPGISLNFEVGGFSCWSKWAPI